MPDSPRKIRETRMKGMRRGSHSWTAPLCVYSYIAATFSLDKWFWNNYEANRYLAFE